MHRTHPHPRQLSHSLPRFPAPEQLHIPCPPTPFLTSVQPWVDFLSTRSVRSLWELTRFVYLSQVTDVKVIRQRPSGQHAGYGFVEFATQYEAQNILNHLNGRPITQHPAVMTRPTPPPPCSHLPEPLCREPAASKDLPKVRGIISMEEHPPAAMPCTPTSQSPCPVPQWEKAGAVWRWQCCPASRIVGGLGDLQRNII